ncbi:oxidoreductase [Limosilactobacillus frumenti DSM 13145]|uniref:Oxidoreductase n=1 Tax=Limosilactobacillus frumenti DSM 13145 TaxID=1423746 RepID=A0A0R1P4B7_9LACO|nr:aldo/keto reductase [Limosilactobacillus frumenti]KRL27479.1 oxidoreductase [Limosilactobacillus frumenti DSM 13145]MBA2913256.1 aldo/keto reductase [Limosilactobacillus frumenti]QFG72912.1 aldo/keto reductase [Limosilactobacillus frumenti]
MKMVKINHRNLPAVGIGTWNLGDSSTTRQDEIAAVQAAINAGARVIDTAEMYGNGRSEKLISQAIQPFNREDLFIIDKVLPSNAGKANLEHRLDRSLKMVGTDYFDLYLLHWRGSIPLAETVIELERMQQKGKIKSWGVSNFDTADMKELWKLPDGNHCVANEDLYNLDERGIEYNLIPWMNDHQVPLIAYSPLAEADTISGKLTHNKVLQEIATNHSASVYQIMLAWTIRNDNVLTIPKAGQKEHAVDNVTAGQITFTADELTALSQEFPTPTHKEPLAII